MADLDLWTSSALGVIAFAFGVAFGWRLRAMLRDPGLELRAQSAEIDRLRAALTDSQKRCDHQSHWLAALEAELGAPDEDAPTPTRRPPAQPYETQAL